MSAVTIHPRKWGKGDTVIIGGVSYLVNRKPKKTEGDYWEVCTTTTAGTLFTHYMKEVES